MPKLALGTVQFGLDYGINNISGKLSLLEAKKLLLSAEKANIDLLDTAISYGNSENILGKVGVSNFDIVTKLPHLPKICDDINFWVEAQLSKSLKKLDLKSAYGLLIHNPADLFGGYGKDLVRALQLIKSKGIVKKIGISIYNPSDLNKLLSIMNFDLIQAPLNIIDRRLEKSGWLSRLYQEGIEIHTRSTFLQGLLLMKKKEIPKKFKKWSHLLDKWFNEIDKNNSTALKECLSYPLSLSKISRIIVGVDNNNHLIEIIDSINKVDFEKDWSFMSNDDEMLINPINWDKI